MYLNDLSNKNVIHIKKDGVEFLQFRKLLEYSDIINHAYSLGTSLNFKTEDAIEGKYSGEKLENAMKSYKKLCSVMDSNYCDVIKPRQKHTKEVKYVREKEVLDIPNIHSEKYNNTDGLITNVPKVMLSTTNADCILIMFFDPVKKVIANVHSGWKGTLQKISVEAVRKMQKGYACKPQDIICCICPSIRKCHFEVEKDVKDMFENEFGRGNIFTKETIKGEKWHIDTVEINKHILKEVGLVPSNIIDSGICSVCNKNLVHSFRAEGKNYGLSTALIELR